MRLSKEQSQEKILQAEHSMEFACGHLIEVYGGASPIIGMAIEPQLVIANKLHLFLRQLREAMEATP